LEPSLGKGFRKKFCRWRFEALAIVAFVGLLGWSIVKPSASIRDASVRPDGAIGSSFEFTSVAVYSSLHDNGAASGRPVYPYSIIPGGAVSAAELRTAMARDPVVAAHYVGFDLAKTRVFRVQQARAVYVSYRRRNDVFWTSKKLRLAVGETLITDGDHILRTRCGNQISDVPRTPVSLVAEPVPETLDTPLVSQIIQPFLAPISGEIADEVGPAGVLPFVALGTRGGGTTGAPDISPVSTIPIAGGGFSPSPPTPTPEPSSIILLSTGLGVVYLFRRLRKT
jgi:hypothetical protein